MRRLWLRFANVFRGRRAEREMSREMNAHLALLQEDFERRGLPAEEAAIAARRAFREHSGGVEQAKELHREARSFVWIEQFFKDIRYAWGGLRRNPGFSLTAVLALALGIGVNATVFGIYNAIALKPLPVADPDRVVRIERWFASHGLGNTQYNFAYTEYQYLREHGAVFADVVAAKSQIAALAAPAGAAAAERVNGYAVSANYFSALGVKALIGRTFLPDEDRVPGANPVVVLDYRYWQRTYHGDANIIGRSIQLNGAVYTIIGVAPREFTGTESFPLECAFWAPLSMLDRLDSASGAASNPTWREQWRDPSTHSGFELLARLKPGVTKAQAQGETDLLIRQYLSGYQQTDRTTAVTLQPTAYFGNTDDIRFHAAAAGVLLLVSLVLLVACANVANMLLARGVARQREIGIRLALGASRGRVVRQLLTESLLLSLLGGAAGMLLSVWAARTLWLSLSTIFQGLHLSMIELDLTPDAHVLGYGLALSLLTGAAFGLAPALQSTRAGFNTALRQDGSPSGMRLGRSRLRGLLLGTQVTVSVLLLVLGFATANALVSSHAGDLGFEARDTYWLLADARSAKMQELRDRLRTLPEVRDAAIGRPPLNGTYTPPMIVGKLYAKALATYASDGYLETLGVGLQRGRSFTRQEAERKAPIAVITESTAKHFWPGQDPLGKHFVLDLNFQNQFTDFEVVGIARDARFADLAQIDQLHVYLASTEDAQSVLLFRIRGDRGRALAAVRSAVESFDASLAPSLVMVSLEDGFVAMQRSIQRVTTSLAGTLTLLSLTLAGVGIFGVMAFLVSQQTREIGIRIALGATARAVFTNILMQGLRPVFVGLATGFALGTAGTVIARATRPFPDAPLAKVIFADPIMYGALALMLAIAALASVIPARRALRVDPAVALRHE